MFQIIGKKEKKGMSEVGKEERTKEGREGGGRKEGNKEGRKKGGQQSFMFESIMCTCLILFSYQNIQKRPTC